ncbi:hypothetical protein Acsp03_12660 [Actinomadura sp. NBRC 104412]|uniref:hypothetical protein n=1 Tax=Actinomadura sp. NBRC 104412 TaxID=3032203 RepID=UPI0024A13880|nr:hypothetical protein [Actinomadura sp. NBRC 104412]GLZ03800.1 hypothetical protein Acsp03_12660 [Actinomadura sp. NBRC 104412]
MADFADLERIIGPPNHPAAPPDWHGIEEGLGFRFPIDYKRFFDLYCYVQFDKYLMVYHPGLDVEMRRRRAISALDSLHALAVEQGSISIVDDYGDFVREQPPFPFFPTQGGLIPWGATEGGEVCMWLMADPVPEKWPIVVSDGVEWWLHSAGFADFIVDVMRGSVQCPIFSKDFPGSDRIDQFPIERFG